MTLKYCLACSAVSAEILHPEQLSVLLLTPRGYLLRQEGPEVSGPTPKVSSASGSHWLKELADGGLMHTSRWAEPSEGCLISS